jgi:hypothetical protein
MQIACFHCGGLLFEEYRENLYACPDFPRVHTCNLQCAPGEWVLILRALKRQRSDEMYSYVVGGVSFVVGSKSKPFRSIPS